jgi:DNA polymerase-3 subunit delta'
VGEVPAAAAPARGFAGVVGHERIIALLRSQIASRSLSHAYLLIGEPHVGKTTLARAVAEEVLGVVGSKRRLDWHPDFWLDDRDEPLKIDEIRFQARDDRVHGQSLQQFLALTPFAGGARVAVLANADRMTDEAANGLLKTLEEPPPASTLILTTARADRLAPTVVSRCQQLSFNPLPDSGVREGLAHGGVEIARAAEIAGLARGRIGWALLAAAGGEVWKRHDGWLQEFLEVSQARPRGIAEYAQRFGEDREPAQREARAEEALGVWQLWLRDALVVAAGTPELAVHQSRQQDLKAFAARWPAERLAGMLQLSLEAQQRVEQHVNPRLAMQVFLMEAFATPPA